MEIKPFSFNYWDDFVDFINKYWAQNHPITNIDLFKWQYRGYGENEGITNSKVLYVDGKFCGFRGVIPGLYQYKKGKDNIITPGKSFAMWMVHPEIRGKGYGIKLLKEAEKATDVLVSTGINVNTAVPIYLENGYNYLTHLNRYVAPIRIEEYSKLLGYEANEKLLKEWFNEIERDIHVEKPIQIDLLKLEKLWADSIMDQNFFGLYRNRDFWKWRYVDSPFYKYIFFGDYKRGVIITRVEKVTGANKKDVNGIKVIRFIEIIPANRQVWNGNNLEEMTKLIQGVLNWAKIEGCSAADFQISTNKLEPLLLSSGFRLQNSSDKLTNLAGIFAPYRQNPAPINALWKIKGLDKKMYRNRNNTYIVKSDNDMDRPISI